MTVAVRQGVSTSTGSTITLTWTALDGDDTGDWVEASEFADKTIHIFGTFDSATVIIQGSNDPRAITDPGNVSAITLKNPQGTTISKTAADLFAVLENPKYIRPSVSGGGGNTSLSVIVQGKRVS